MKYIKNLHSVLNTDTIKSALVKINRSGIRGVIVINKKKEFLGTITDGDIRKEIIKKTDISKKKVGAITNKKSVVFKKNDNLEKIKTTFLNMNINFAPIVDSKKIIKKILRWEEIFNEEKLNIKKPQVVLMAGGEGTRLLPYTEVLPKPLMPIGGKPMLEHILTKFYNQNFNRFIVSINYKADLIKTYFNNKKYKIKFVKENKKLGTAGSLSLMKKIINTDFFLVNCDVFFDLNMQEIINFHDKKKADITMVVSRENYKIPYGVCELKKNKRLKSIKEKPNLDLYINVGLYYISKKLINLIPKKKFDLPDLINTAKRKKLKIFTYMIGKNSWVDVGQKEDYLKINKNRKI